MSEEVSEKPPKTGKWWLTVLGCLGLVVGGWLLMNWIDSTEPTAERSQAAKKTAMLVQVITAEAGDNQPRIEALGEVQAAREVSLGARVSGEIIARSQAFTEGGVVPEGEVLVRIDPVDYEKILAQRRSEYLQAQAEIDIEAGRQNVAQLDLELLEDTLEVKDKALVLREPQLKSAQAALELAGVAVEQARLDLQRTEVRAPFAAQVMSREVDVGAQLSAGTRIGRLVGLEEYWVVATVPQSALRWMRFKTGEEAMLAEVRDAAAWGEDVLRMGKVERLLGELDEETRLARVVVVVEDPLGRNSEEAVPSLILGSLLDVVILGETIQDVVRLPREYLRKNDTVWVNADGKLNIREVTVTFSDKSFAYLSEGLEAGEEVVTTSLASVTEGAALRTEGVSEGGGDE
ncbi:efflux RND transporter periplasmic adaptor subunit [Roseibacillus persicicus]|uniref:efflux RND transporter periplasmic adaptor subunit n=1 Tax=Roseibacillus persicicus TaxID=454148 RepID=UPI00398A7721